jgi:hypothetical protein
LRRVDELVDEGCLALGSAQAVAGTEEVLRQGDGGTRVERVEGRRGACARIAAELLELLGEQQVCLPGVVQGGLELLVLLLEGLDFEPLALTG